jgi:hypothetical protein
MGDFYEEHVCVKFYFKLGKTFSETFEMLKKEFGDEAMSGTNVLKRAEVQLRTVNIRDDLQHKK